MTDNKWIEEDPEFYGGAWAISGPKEEKCKSDVKEGPVNAGLIDMKEYIMLMLGDPITKVELSDNQLERCIQKAESDVSVYTKRYGACWEHSMKLTRDKALIEAMFLLNRIRAKYRQSQGTMLQDSEILFQHAQLALDEWHRQIEAIIS